MGYTNRTVRLEYPELGDDIWVAIRNPLLVPLSVLQPDVEIQYGEDGQPLDPDALLRASYGVVAKLVVAWNVPDPMDDSDDPVALPLPATTETLRKVPALVIRRINEYVGKALNQTTDDTSTTSSSP